MATAKKAATKPAEKTGPKSSTTFIKKITVKECYGTPELRALPEDHSIVPILRVAGFAQGIKTGEGTYGEWKAILGEFAATNLKTGEIFTSPVAIIPSAMGEMIFQQVQASLMEDASSRVRFAVEIGVMVSKRDKNKYEYTVQPIVDPEVGNPAVALLGLG
jgi:hypothetical protein